MAINTNNTTKINPSSTEPVGEEKTISSLGPEILQECLSYLNTTKDPQSTVQVSHFWKNATIETSRFKERSLARSFGEFLTENLDPKQYSEQIETLANIYRSNTILNSVNLLDLKSSLLDLKEKLIPLLRTLDIKTIRDLKTQSEAINTPHFFEDIFELTVTLKAIDIEFERISAFPFEWERCNAFEALCITLIQQDNIDNAIKVTNAITYEHIRVKLLENICNHLTSVGSIDWAVKVANTFTREYKKITAFENIFINQIDLGHIDWVIKTTNIITKEVTRDHVLKSACKHLLDLGNIDKAVEAAKSITDMYQKECQFQNINELLIGRDNIDKAIEVVKALTSESLIDRLNKNTEILKKRLFDHIIKLLMDRGNIYKAIEIANTHSNANQRHIIFEDACKTFMEQGQIDRALHFANNYIHIQTEKHFIIDTIICKELIQQNNIQKAVEILSGSDDIQMAIIRLETIQEDLIHEGYRDPTNELANTIQNLRETDRLTNPENIHRRCECSIS